MWIEKKMRLLVLFMITILVFILPFSYGTRFSFNLSDRALSIEKHETEKGYLERSIYLDPWLVFQANIGESFSSHYLVAFNILTGDVQKISKGFHRKFWLYDSMLIFQRNEKLYTCPWDEWSSLSELSDPRTKDSYDKRYQSTYEDLPDILRETNIDGIRVVLQGSFTFPQQREFLFLCHDPEGYQAVVFRAYRGRLSFQTILRIEPSSLLKGERLPEIHFAQFIAEDMDGDGCLELITHGVKVGGDDPLDALIYLDLSKPSSGERVQISSLPTLKDSKTKDFPRLIREGRRQIYLEYGPSDPLLPGLIEQFLIELDPQGKPAFVHKGKRWHEPFEGSITPLHQDFYSSRRNLQSGERLDAPAIEAFPSIIFPFLRKEPASADFEEKLYHRERNKAIEAYAEKINQGWNPFEEVERVHPTMDPAEDLFASWMECTDIIPVLNTQKQYQWLVSNIFSRSGAIYWILMLYSSSFQLQDIWCPDSSNYLSASPRLFPVEGEHHQTAYARTLLPLPGERSILFIYPGFWGKHSLEGIKVEDTFIKPLFHFKGYAWRYLRHHSGTKLETLHYLNSLSIGFFSQTDPLNGQLESALFISRFEFHLDELYRLFYITGPQDASLDTSFEPSVAILDLIEAYEALVFYRRQELLEMILRKTQWLSG